MTTGLTFAVTDRVAELATAAVVAEWRAQGHELTGKAAREVETRTREKAGAVIIEGYVLDYMATLNEGVAASRIPYSPGSGAGRSRYIAGLERYARARMGASAQEATRIAFAIARRHKREGMPTRASQTFSSTGRRTGFIEAALDKAEDELGKLIEAAVAESFDLLIDSFFRSVLSGR